MIKEQRLRIGLTQKQLAEKVGRSQQLVQKWENGTSQPTSKQLKMVSEILQIPITSLVGSYHQEGETQNAVAETANLLQTQPGNVSAAQPRTTDMFVEVPFLSAKAQAGSARLILDNCTPHTGETHPVLAELIDSRYKYLVVTIEGHSMEPELRQGIRVLTRWIENDQIAYESGGVYLVLYADRLVIKRIRTNDLRSTSTLTLHSDNEQYGQINVLAAEIQCMWKVLYKIYEPVR